mmetsp:Transcript_19699/g.32370  ORF Transcript_19699/g.32370 Transcript_19699/m.32370 type:complete len:201 (+) Transcript_19699:187-789(+)
MVSNMSRRETSYTSCWLWSASNFARFRTILFSTSCSAMALSERETTCISLRSKPKCCTSSSSSSVMCRDWKRSNNRIKRSLLGNSCNNSSTFLNVIVLASPMSRFCISEWVGCELQWWTAISLSNSVSPTPYKSCSCAPYNKRLSLSRSLSAGFGKVTGGISDRINCILLLISSSSCFSSLSTSSTSCISSAPGSLSSSS